MEELAFIELDHGTGAKLSQDLIDMITSTLEDVHLGKMEDSAILPMNASQIAMTTDSFVVAPPFFGNGDIGKIAVAGTVNDLAVMGAKPLYLTLAMIIEEGFPIRDLKRIVSSVREAAREAKVKIVAGDTKVVAKGEADKIFLNTAGVGIFEREPLSTSKVSAGDKMILSSNIGDHSIHLLSIREGLGYESRVLSDCAPLNNHIDKLLSSKLGESVMSIRDVTRGGLAEVMHEFSQKTGRVIACNEDALPIRLETEMAADMLGVNPIHLANEGCLCMFVKPDMADEVVAFLREFEHFKNACVIGEVTKTTGTGVLMSKKDGMTYELEQLIGAELPRLC
ncbi:hydrogenase metallocenter (NiFe) assembly protein HypE [Photobacterium marinum]|uniref:Hydrogenase metallocenter (NiFe) assembly protein HypE n=1 Tax=Photobacterium marinum TaxID=1056511 RepID=L8JBQ3_9GAMM|nr:hydrogenase expression/formation protein HypE [Photobacterium marinum]ELR66240.1 hydrogenase metallocenter (NiFe) assembly protein HypE [Photobacterium marinum]